MVSASRFLRKIEELFSTSATLMSTKKLATVGSSSWSRTKQFRLDHDKNIEMLEFANIRRKGFETILNFKGLGDLNYIKFHIHIHIGRI